MCSYDFVCVWITIYQKYL